jgi:hypothetical protein
MVGTWDVTSSCLTANGDIDLSRGALFCTAQLVTRSLQVSGVWTANGDGAFADGTHTAGSHHLELGEE